MDDLIFDTEIDAEDINSGSQNQNNTSISQDSDVTFSNDGGNSNIIEESTNTVEVDNNVDNGDITIPEPSESSDGVTNAGIVENNFVVVDTYERGSEPDSYQFEISQRGTYDVELGNLEANLDLSIDDSEGNTIYSSSESGNESEFIAAEFESGAYTIYIAGEEDVETDYRLSIQTSSEDNSDNDSATETDSTPILSEGDAVYRFFEIEGQTQFYTTSETERDLVIESLPNYEYEGELFTGAPNPEGDDITGVVPVYRLFNVDTGVHLYTASELERDAVIENLPNYTSEGISYYGYESQEEDSVPLYRFYNSGLDAHFYTSSIAERDEYLASPDYQPEGGSGIAYYVQPVDDI